MSDADISPVAASTAKRSTGASRPDFTSDDMYAPLVAILGVDSLSCLSDTKTFNFTWFKERAAEHSKVAGREKPVGAFNSWSKILNELLSPLAETDVHAQGMDVDVDVPGDVPAVAEEAEHVASGGCNDEILDEACALVEVLLSGIEFEVPAGMTDEHYERLVKGVEARIAELEHSAALQFEELKQNEGSVGNVCEFVKVIAFAHACRLTFVLTFCAPPVCLTARSIPLVVFLLALSWSPSG
jgi:hypothetical protein